MLDLTQDLTDFYGNEIKDGDKPLTLRHVFQTALLTTMPGDESMSPETKVMLWNLAQDTRSDAVEWTQEQIDIVCVRVQRGYSVMVVGAVLGVLNG
jgi:hypothetical protein